MKNRKNFCSRISRRMQ